MPTVWVESGIQELSSLQRRHLNWCPDVVFWFWSVSCSEALQIPGGSSLTTQSLEMWILTLLQNATMLKGRVLQIIIVKDAAPCIISSKCIEDNVPSYNSFFFFLITSKCHFPLFWYFFFDFALLRCSFLDRNLIAVLCWGVPFNFKVEANVWFSNSFSLEKVLSGFLLAVGNGTRLLCTSRINTETKFFILQRTILIKPFTSLSPSSTKHDRPSFQKNWTWKEPGCSTCSPQATHPMQCSLTGVVHLTCQCHGAGPYSPLKKGV